MPSILDGAKIKALREARGMNQSVTAKLSGINQGNLSKIETGSRRVTRPSHATVVALAKTLGVKPSEICGEGAGDEDGAEAILARLLLVREAASMAVRADKMSQKERAALLRSLRSLCSVTDARNAARFVSSWLAMHRRIDTN